MKVKNKNPIKLLKGVKVDSIIELYYQFNHLKQLYRQGWLQHNIPENKCESDAEHCFGVALLALFITEKFFPKLNIHKVLTMALIHEFAEIYIGDFTPLTEINREERLLEEKETVSKIFANVDNGNKYSEIFNEFIDQKTEEAQLVRNIDYLEMSLQTGIYENQNNASMEEFFIWTREKLTIPKIKELFEDIVRLRKKLSVIS